MNETLPSFRKPPVVETAVSAQFRPINGFTNAHLGLFWERIRGAYPKAVDAEPIIPQTEAFGEEARRRLRLPGFRIMPGAAAARLQMISEDDRGMVQVQNGRLIYNWRGGAGATYPRWHRVFPDFQTVLHEFEALLGTQGLARIEPNQWEVTYVNHLRKGHDWLDATEWPKLLPGLIGSMGLPSAAPAESVACNMTFALADQKGRLHVTLQHGFASADRDAEELLVLQLTARGGVDRASSADLFSGFHLGRRAIVEKFAAITGAEAHRKWERER